MAGEHSLLICFERSLSEDEWKKVIRMAKALPFVRRLEAKAEGEPGPCVCGHMDYEHRFMSVADGTMAMTCIPCYEALPEADRTADTYPDTACVCFQRAV